MKASKSGRHRRATALPRDLVLGLAAVAATLLAAAPTWAGLYASLDRYTIAMGDTVRLTLRSDGDADPADADLSALRDLFDILQRSSSVSTRIVNGQRSQNRELLLELTPLRKGDLIIPPFEVDKERSEALAVTVGEPPKIQADDEIVTFEAIIDREEVYVQGQLLLTLRVQQAVNLESRSITELDIDNAFVETLGQNSFQRMIDGRPWLVHEIRYAIFPESSGELRIPAQSFSGRMGAGRRTLFDTRPSGRLIRRRTDDIVVPVLPRPASFPDGTWLPAADVTVEEQWSGSLDQLRIGDSLTRTISVSGAGLQGAQLPPIETLEIDGLRAYPDQPTINNVNGDQGVTGVRTDSVALVAVRDGEYELPPLEIPWWDTASNTLRYARLPARRVRVLPNALPPGETPADALPTPTPAAATTNSTAGAWPWIAAFCALGWLLTSLWFLRRKPSSETRPDVVERASSVALRKACRANDARLARRELHAWLRGQQYAGTLTSWLREQNSDELDAAIHDLESALFGAGAGAKNWDGSALLRALDSIDKAAATPEEQDLPALYLSR